MARIPYVETNTAYAGTSLYSLRSGQGLTFISALAPDPFNPRTLER